MNLNFQTPPPKKTGSNTEICKKNKNLIFRYAESGLTPFRVSKKTDCDFSLDLLLLSDGQMHHYVLIRNLHNLIHRVRERVPRIENYLCRNCFHVSTSKERYNNHIGFCQQNKQAVVKMPQETSFNYKRIQSRWFAPIVGFFDLESIIESVSGCRNNPLKAETRIIGLHKPCSYAMLFVG